VAPWFRGLLTLDPEPGLMVDASFVFQLHATVAWLLYAFWPFSRLVHAWSVPVGYFGRAQILYRSRTAGRRTAVLAAARAPAAARTGVAASQAPKTAEEVFR
jgi:nitrate reductase gamma subunit